MHGKAAYVHLKSFDVSLLTSCRSLLPMDYALYLVPAIPKTPTGKVDRQQLERLVGLGDSEQAACERVEQAQFLIELLRSAEACHAHVMRMSCRRSSKHYSSLLYTC